MLQLITCGEIQLLMVVVMARPLLALAANSFCPQLLVEQRSFTRLPPNDALFTEDVILEVSARSRIDCSKKCVETEGCVMCTFLSSPQGPPGHCRLHSQLKSPSDVNKRMPGAKTLRRVCDEGYVLTCGHCLKAVKDYVTYTTARQGCSQMEACLVMPRSTAEAKCVWDFVKSSDLRRSWVGADDLEVPRVFRWNDGTRLLDNSPMWRWQNNDPDHEYPGNNCVALGTWYPNFFDENCLSSYQYLCQKDSL